MFAYDSLIVYFPNCIYTNLITFIFFIVFEYIINLNDLYGNTGRYDYLILMIVISKHYL